MKNSKNRRKPDSYPGMFSYVLQHGEPLLHKLGMATTRNTSELNHALNRLERQLDDLSDKIKSADENRFKK